MNKYFVYPKKKKSKKHLFSFLLYLFFVCFIFAFFFIYYFHRTLGPGLIRCAEDEVEKLSVLTLNNGVRKYMANHDMGDILQIVRKENGDISLVRYDTKKLNQFTIELTSLLTKDLDLLVKGNFEDLDLDIGRISSNSYLKVDEGILFMISLGSATGNSLLANIGPKIPLNLSVIGNVQTDVHSKVTNYGLNNAMIEIFVDIQMQMVIQMPFLSKKVKIKKSIPLTMEMVQGEIPNYYLDSESKDNSSIKNSVGNH
ncbi:MAG: sporulation protein YunB [Bacilli bacterium]|nr:sporulation protein YunB [Bacilli bacterium]